MEECKHAGRQIGQVQIISDSGKQVGNRYFWYCDECNWGWETETQFEVSGASTTEDAEKTQT